VNDFCEQMRNTYTMSRSSTVLLALLLLFTFPIWFGVGMGLIGGAIGIVAGVFGAVFGVIGGIFGAIFHGIFGWGHDWHFFPHMHGNRFAFFAFIIIVALIMSKRNKKAK
jgi:hypothetical protein